jgi:DNA-binding SARP family transcriptional activator
MRGAGLWIGLLGPLEIRRDGRPLPSPRGKSAVVAAVLALSAGRPVTLNAIADHVWRHRLPERVPGSLHSHVLRLRGALGREAIRTVASGYVLDIDADQVDVGRFRRLLAEAAGVDDAEERRALLDRALRLWRGEPLSGLRPESFEHDEVPLLVEERLTAVQQRIELDLSAGRHADVATELRDLTIRHPLREPLWRQLISALSASGRQAEALEAYHDLRIRLRDDLGVNPSADLQELYRSLLAGPPAAGNRIRAPTTVPAPATPLVGRERELSTVGSTLGRADVRLVTLSGAGGAGKTRLALAAAQDPAGEIAGHAVLVDLARLTDPADVWAAVQEALRLHDARDRRAPQRVVADLAASRTFLLLDNFEHLLPASDAVATSVTLAVQPEPAALRDRGPPRR